MGRYAEPFRRLSDEFNRQREAIENNIDLPERSKNLRLARLKTDYRDRWNQQKAALEGQFESDYLAAYRRAYPAPDFSVGIRTMDTGGVIEEIRKNQARSEIIEAMRSNPHGIIAMHEDFYKRGYDFGLEVIEEKGGQFLSGNEAAGLQEIADIRNPGRVEARKAVDQVQAEQSSDGQAIGLLEMGFMSQVQLDAAESNELGKANAGQFDAARVSAGQQAAE
jgi:hypothetical protein